MPWRALRLCVSSCSSRARQATQFRWCQSREVGCQFTCPPTAMSTILSPSPGLPVSRSPSLLVSRFIVRPSSCVLHRLLSSHPFSSFVIRHSYFSPHWPTFGVDSRCHLWYTYVQNTACGAGRERSSLFGISIILGNRCGMSPPIIPRLDPGSHFALAGESHRT
jgi:hypothetical protein